MTEQLREMIDRALNRATADIQAIASDAGVSHDTLRAWKNGRRNRDPRELADAIERRGGELQALAEELREVADG